MIRTLLATSTNIVVHVMEGRGQSRAESGVVTTIVLVALMSIVAHVMEGISPGHRESGCIPVTLLAIPKSSVVHAMGGIPDHRESGRVMLRAERTAHAGLAIGEGSSVIQY
jgi:hypothetical protein